MLSLLPSFSPPLSPADAALYVHKYNTLLQEAKEWLRSDKDVCGCFANQWKFVERLEDCRATRKALASTALLSGEIAKAVKVPELLRLPVKQKEIAVDCFRKFFLFRRYLGKLLGHCVTSDAELMNDMTSEIIFNPVSIKELLQKDSSGIDCFEHKDDILFARVLMERPDELLIIKPIYSSSGKTGNLLYTIKYSELTICSNKNNERGVILETNYDTIELVFEDKEKATEIYNKIKDDKKKSGEKQLSKIEAYLDNCTVSEP